MIISFDFLNLRNLHVFFSAAFLALVLTPDFVRADTGSSAWKGNENGKVRLFAGGKADGGALYAGIEVKLLDGWKTYWRSPGESGIPPEFDWSGSKNVKAVIVHWPAPHRFRDETGENIGYKSAVLFPLSILPIEYKQPVELRLNVNFGICKNICIPMQAEFSLNVPPGGVAENQPLIAHSLQKVPVKKLPHLKVASVTARNLGPNVMLEIVIDTSRDQPLDVFVEGAPNYFFNTPKPSQVSTKGSKFLEVTVDGAKSAEQLSGTGIVVTVVQGEQSLEYELILE
jgi:DsbC/DsbD-like thiol-disulfide interchange protein